MTWLRSWRATTSLNYQAISFASGIALAQGLTAVMYVIAARQADPRAFGAVVAAIAVGLATAGVLDFGSNSLWIRELASRRLCADQLGRRVLAKVGWALFVASIWMTVAWHFAATWFSVVAATIAVTSVITQAMSVLPRAGSRADLEALALFVDRVTAFSILSFVVFGIHRSPILGLWLGLSVGALVGALAAWLLSPAEFRYGVRRRQAVNPWRGSGAFGVSALANSGQTLDVAILSMAAGSSAAGLYGAVSRWTQPLNLIANAFSQASAPMMASATSWQEAWRRVRGSVWLLGLAATSCVGVALAAPFLVRMLLGNDYVGSSAVLSVLAVATIPAIVNQPVASFLQARGLQRPVSVLFVVSVGLQLLAVPILAPELGTLSAPLALLVGQVLLLAGLSGVVSKHIRAERRRVEEVRLVTHP